MSHMIDLRILVLAAAVLSTLNATLVRRLFDLIPYMLVRVMDVGSLHALFRSFGFTRESVEAIVILLENEEHNFAQYYDSIREPPERLEKLLSLMKLDDPRHHKTLFSPSKLLENPVLAKAIFMKPPGDKVVYFGEFMNRRLPVFYFSAMYNVDPELGMEMLRFAVENQMNDMTSPDLFALFIQSASKEHVIEIFRMLIPDEMTPALLRVFYKSGKGRKSLSKIYIDDSLSDDELYARCVALQMAFPKSKALGHCHRRFPEMEHAKYRHKYPILERGLSGRNDPASIMTLYKCEKRATKKSARASKAMTTLRRDGYKIVRYLAPFYLFKIIHSIRKQTIEYDDELREHIPPSHLPTLLRPLDMRLKYFRYEGPFKVTARYDHQIYFGPFNYSHLYMSINGRLGRDPKIRIANATIGWAQECLRAGLVYRFVGAMYILNGDFVELALLALGYALMDGVEFDVAPTCVHRSLEGWQWFWKTLELKFGSHIPHQLMAVFKYFTDEELRLLLAPKNHGDTCDPTRQNMIED